MNAPRKLLFVIAAVPAAQLQNTAANAQRIVRQWNLKSAEGDASVTFLQMDTDKWGKWLNSMCGIKAEEDTQVGVANNSFREIGGVEMGGQCIAQCEVGVSRRTPGLSASSPPSHCTCFAFTFGENAAKGGGATRRDVGVPGTLYIGFFSETLYGGYVVPGDLCWVTRTLHEVDDRYTFCSLGSKVSVHEVRGWQTSDTEP
ncbi:hypothetical protein FOMPIDRAFT_117726 [Fomitopsis schrenkii]|uniref:Uncharacterized protein n=1 Tax=Fomitopsis schrenkii TaxID=2126942 RepID=S8F240_FOMSC|nr:hypothetical protein FOMPIDRAFT_117726 [Fomitopsis schrenkii]